MPSLSVFINVYKGSVKMTAEQTINIERVEFVYGLFGNMDENIHTYDRKDLFGLGDPALRRNKDHG